MLLTIQRHSIILCHSSLGINTSTINDGTSAQRATTLVIMNLCLDESTKL